MKITSKDILKLFDGKDLDKEEQFYLSYHAERLAFTTTLVQRYVTETGAKNLLDVGPHMLTYCLKKLVTPTPDISTLGFAYERMFPAELTKHHFEVDLNRCREPEFAPLVGEFDLIVFSETIEHLYTAPSLIISYLSKYLKSGAQAGLLIQTPNAVSFSKRVQMLLGRNPFEQIREELHNPGHFREYTITELEKLGADAGFSVWCKQFCSYWSKSSKIKQIIDVYPPLREGLTLLFTR